MIKKFTRIALLLGITLLASPSLYAQEVCISLPAYEHGDYSQPARSFTVDLPDHIADILFHFGLATTGSC